MKELSALSDFTSCLDSTPFMHLPTFVWPLLPPGSRLFAQFSVENFHVRSCLLTYCLLWTPPRWGLDPGMAWVTFSQERVIAVSVPKSGLLYPQRLQLCPPCRTQMQSGVSMTSLKGYVSPFGRKGELTPLQVNFDQWETGDGGWGIRRSSR